MSLSKHTLPHYTTLHYTTSTSIQVYNLFTVYNSVCGRHD